MIIASDRSYNYSTAVNRPFCSSALFSSWKYVAEIGRYVWTFLFKRKKNRHTNEVKCADIFWTYANHSCCKIFVGYICGIRFEGQRTLTAIIT